MTSNTCQPFQPALIAGRLSNAGLDPNNTPAPRRLGDHLAAPCRPYVSRQPCTMRPASDCKSISSSGISLAAPFKMTFPIGPADQQKPPRIDTGLRKLLESPLQTGRL